MTVHVTAQAASSIVVRPRRRMWGGRSLETPTDARCRRLPWAEADLQPAVAPVQHQLVRSMRCDHELRNDGFTHVGQSMQGMLMQGFPWCTGYRASHLLYPVVPRSPKTTNYVPARVLSRFLTRVRPLATNTLDFRPRNGHCPWRILAPALVRSSSACHWLFCQATRPVHP